MALPKLNDTPKYHTKVPSTGKEITYRPFLVKEEKVLLLALESADPKQIGRAILDTVVACTYDNIREDDLTGYDVEYLFLHIRGKSVGETSNIVLTCSNCNHENPNEINLDKIEVPSPPKDNIVSITNQISVEMRQPSFVSLSKNKNIASDKISDQVFGLIQESIAAILTDEERIDVKDTSYEEFQEFLDSMTGAQFAKLREYVEQMPTVRTDVQYSCEKCGTEHNVTIQGMQNFLS